MILKVFQYKSFFWTKKMKRKKEKGWVEQNKRKIKYK